RERGGNAIHLRRELAPGEGTLVAHDRARVPGAGGGRVAEVGDVRGAGQAPRSAGACGGLVVPGVRHPALRDEVAAWRREDVDQQVALGADPFGGVNEMDGN